MMQVRRTERSVFVQPRNPVLARAPQSNSAANLAAGLSDVGDMFAQMQEEIDVADAKSADAAFTEQVNDLLYNDETGFMYEQGGNATSRRNDTVTALGEAQKSVLSQLSPAARRRAEASVTARMQSAMTSVNRHTAGERRTYLNDAANARVNASVNAAIFDPTASAQQIAVAEQEVRDIAAREGWAPEATEVKLQEVRDTAYRGIIDRMARVDPQAALEYARENRDRLSGEGLANIERTLVPMAKEFRGRGLGAAAAGANLPQAMSIARQTDGMSETAQRDALQEYLANGGVNLDPATTAWCAAFVNATLAQAGMKGTNSNLARSFLNWGVEVQTPQKGDLVVLSRGDPNGWQGHVGFFDGFNEDGSIRVLGGNQGDAVNVKSYSADRLLGYRRGTKEQPSSMRDLLNIEDADVRDAALQEYRMRVGVAEQEQKAMEADASRTVMDLVEAGGSVNDLPVETRQNLGPEIMAAARRYEAQKRSSEELVTDSQTYVDLSRMATEQPGEFVKMDPMLFRWKLDDADHKYFVNLQNKIRSGESRSAPSVATMLSTADAFLRRSGITKNDDPERYALFQESLTRWAASNPGDAGDIGKQLNTITSMLVPIVINPSGMINQRRGLAFEFDTDGRTFTPDDDLTAETYQDAINNNGLRINDQLVTPELEAQVFNGMRERLGREPTLQEMLTALTLYLR
ncbi:MAG: TIGR02594 family protein [Pseudomonadota bacterium]